MALGTERMHNNACINIKRVQDVESEANILKYHLILAAHFLSLALYLIHQANNDNSNNNNRSFLTWLTALLNLVHF